MATLRSKIVALLLDGKSTEEIVRALKCRRQYVVECRYNLNKLVPKEQRLRDKEPGKPKRGTKIALAYDYLQKFPAATYEQVQKATGVSYQTVANARSRYTGRSFNETASS